MKVLSTILATTFLAAACGADNKGSNTAGEPALPEPSVMDQIIGIQGVEHALVMDTQVVSMDEIGSSTTLVELGFGLGCANELADLSYEAHKAEDGKIEVHLSAYELVSRLSLVARCAEIFPSHRAEITLDGAYSADDIELKFGQLANTKVELPKELASVEVTEDVQIGQVTPLCPAGVTCVTDGTVIELNVGTFGCVDTAALSWSMDASDNSLDLYVGALNLASKDSATVRCIQQNVETFQISLVGQFFTKEQINLHIQSR